MLNASLLNASCRLALEVLCGEVTSSSTLRSTKVTVSGLRLSIRQPSGNVTRAVVLGFEGDLMAKAGEVVRQSSVHQLKRVNFNIWYPLTATGIRVDPERKPVRPIVALKFVVEIELSYSIAADAKGTNLTSMLVDARIVVHSLAGVGSFDGV